MNASSRLACAHPIDHDGATWRRLVVFFGTRPETIKLAPLLQAVATSNLKLRHAAVFTGQHPDLVAPFQRIFDLRIDAHVQGTFEPGQSLAQLTAKLISNIDGSIEHCPRDIWAVQGDTTSAFAAGYVGFLRGTPVLHVEAGLRTFDMRSPFPEELNRRAIGLMAQLHAAPTAWSRQNLIGQGVAPERVAVTGNTGIDAVRIAQRWLVPPEGVTEADAASGLLFATMHRRENAAAQAFGRYYEAIGNASACTHDARAKVVIPVHPNHAATVAARAACEKYDHFRCVAPLGYAESQWVLRHSLAVVTDSGGLQEEATWYGTPVLILRESTERPEAIYAGNALLAADVPLLAKSLGSLCTRNSSLRAQMSTRTLPFGDGHAAERILQMLLPATATATATATASTASATAHHEHHQHHASSAAAVAAAARLERLLDSRSLAMRPAETIVPRECSKSTPRGWEECSVPHAVTVVLTVYRRHHTLPLQLRAAAQQTLRPDRILVVESKDDAPAVAAHPSPRVVHVPLGTNGRYHTRFFVAHALSTAQYVSIWDDDGVPSPEWLRRTVQMVRARNGSLITSNGRYITQLMAPGFKRLHGAPNPENAANQDKACPADAPVDFGGHAWTLPRDALRHYFAEAQFTRATAEDVQLSFALQRRGIATYCADGESTSRYWQVLGAAQDASASYRNKQVQVPRQLVFCQLLEAGFVPQRCVNCDRATVQRCLDFWSDSVRRLPAWQLEPPGDAGAADEEQPVTAAAAAASLEPSAQSRGVHLPATQPVALLPARYNDSRNAIATLLIGGKTDNATGRVTYERNQGIWNRTVCFQHRLRMLGSSFPLVVVHNFDEDNIASYFDRTHRVPRNLNQKSNAAATHINKFFVFNLTDYERVLYIDSDVYVQLPLDRLFDLFPLVTTPLAAVAATCSTTIFNSGVLLFRPSVATANALVRLLSPESRSILHHFPKHACTGSFTGDQWYLNGYFGKNWTSLPPSYNKQFKWYGKMVHDTDVNIHFTGDHKPAQHLCGEHGTPYL